MCLFAGERARLGGVGDCDWNGGGGRGRGLGGWWGWWGDGGGGCEGGFDAAVYVCLAEGLGVGEGAGGELAVADWAFVFFGEAGWGWEGAGGR